MDDTERSCNHQGAVLRDELKNHIEQGQSILTIVERQHWILCDSCYLNTMIELGRETEVLNHIFRKALGYKDS